MENHRPIIPVAPEIGSDSKQNVLSATKHPTQCLRGGQMLHDLDDLTVAGGAARLRVRLADQPAHLFREYATERRQIVRVVARVCRLRFRPR